MVDLPAPAFPRPDASVRAARKSDAAALAAVTAASWRGQYAAVLPTAAALLDEAALTDRWAQALEIDDASSVLVATSGDDVVGLAVVGPGADPDLEERADEVAEVVELAVRPGATRQGHGSRLLAAAVDRARSAGFVAVVVWCGARDDARRAFLVSSGLEPDGATRTLDDGSGTAWRQVRLAASIVDD
jgi:GNAT superfamily N-acetyltransferase